MFRFRRTAVLRQSRIGVSILFDWVLEVQTAMHRVIAGDLNAFATGRDWLALAAVFPLGILFGSVHALTPGHGKSMLASYVLGTRLQSLRAAGLALVLSLTHVGMAVLLALLAAPLIIRTLGGAGRAPALEAASGALLMCIGAWMLLRALNGGRHHKHEGTTMAIFAGLVPCPLTLFVMMFALSKGVPEAGLVFAAAMMSGVMATLATVAVLTALARDRILTVVANFGNSIERITHSLDVLSGLLIIGLGLAQLMR